MTNQNVIMFYINVISNYTSRADYYSDLFQSTNKPIDSELIMKHQKLEMKRNKWIKRFLREYHGKPKS